MGISVPIRYERGGVGVGGCNSAFHRRVSKPFVNSTETVHGTVKN
eukprot:SAG31_NODE_46631_length_253_cov_1.097403_1_plen_44_part_10